MDITEVMGGDTEMMSVERDNASGFSNWSKMKCAHGINYGNKEVNPVSKVPSKYFCPFCQKIMIEPIQTVRGEVACRKCYVKKQEEGNGVCPIDGEPISSDEFFQDRSITREISKIVCACSNVKYGCQWKGALSDINAHEEKCEFVAIICDDCRERVGKLQLEQHQQNSCKARQVQCLYCFQHCRASEVKLHDFLCENKPYECPLGCSDEIKIGDLLEHSKTCSGLVSGQFCPFHKLGCGYESNQPENLKKHLEEAIMIHTMQALVYFMTAQRNQQASNYCIKELHNKINTLLANVESLENQVADLQKSTGHLKHLERIENRIAKIKTPDHKIDDKITQLESMQRDLLKLNSQSPVIQQHTEVMKIANTLESNRNKIEQIDRDYAVLNSSLADTELKLCLLENTTYNGRQVWKIDNLQYRMTQSRNGRVTALHSAPTYTEAFGYKFCTRLYLNGDGIGKGTHLSIFFVVMKSQYDDLLKWPFVKRVTFRILNHESSSRARKETFLTDRNSSSFQQPKKEMNIAAGCPKFLNISTLLDGGFVVDDSIFVETIVEDAEKT